MWSQSLLCRGMLGYFWRVWWGRSGREGRSSVMRPMRWVVCWTVLLSNSLFRHISCTNTEIQAYEGVQNDNSLMILSRRSRWSISVGTGIKDCCRRYWSSYPVQTVAAHKILLISSKNMLTINNVIVISITYIIQCDPKSLFNSYVSALYTDCGHKS